MLTKAKLKKLLNKFPNKPVDKLLFIAGIVVLAGVVFVVINKSREEPEIQAGGSEIQMILASSNPEEQARLYRQLLERVGPEEGQEQLFRSGMPFTGEGHLLNHTSGDYIFEKEGIKGITKCKKYFLESCYHGLLLHVIGGDADKDFDEVKKAVDYCNEAGQTVITQCSHGIGHGYVAAAGYANLDIALEQCKKIAARIDYFPVFNCYDGAFMENVFGVHSGKPSPNRWVKETDDLYPCNDPRLKPEHINPCWNNQASLLYARYQGDLKKLSDVCLTVTPDDIKLTCFDGLSRQIHPLTDNNYDTIVELCGKLNTDWQSFCRVTNALSAYSVGDRKVAYEICAKSSGDKKPKCYDDLMGVIKSYARSYQDREQNCNLIKEADSSYRKKCLAK